MIAMQYTVRLPPNYSVDRLRRRVAEERGPIFDSMPGLAHKSFLLDSELRTYAPFYVWHSHNAMREFLFGPVFGATVSVFDRPRIRHWSVVAYNHADKTIMPTFACYELDRVERSDLQNIRVREVDAHQKRLSQPGLYFQIVALDFDRWEICRFSLWAEAGAHGKSDADSSLGYEVLHISEPDKNIALVTVP